jgi:hypothetical protein
MENTTDQNTNYQQKAIAETRIKTELLLWEPSQFGVAQLKVLGQLDLVDQVKNCDCAGSETTPASLATIYSTT